MSEVDENAALARFKDDKVKACVAIKLALEAPISPDVVHLGTLEMQGMIAWKIADLWKQFLDTQDIGPYKLVAEPIHADCFTKDRGFHSRDYIDFVLKHKIEKEPPT